MQTNELKQTAENDDEISKTEGVSSSGSSGGTADAIAELGTGTAPGKRSRLSKTLPTDRLVFPKQQEIIRAYAAASEKHGRPVTIEDVTEFVGMAPATISQANPFFTDTGVIVKEGRKFSVSPELKSMFQMFPISQQRAWAKLAPLFERAWFGQILIPKLKFRPMTDEDAVHDLAEAATAEKDHLPQLRLIIDYMVLVGLVQRDGNLLKLINHREGAEHSAAKPRTESEKPMGAASPDQSEEGLERYSLTLDPSSKRRIVLHAPPAISGAELKRIQQWLSFQLIITDDGGAQT